MIRRLLVCLVHWVFGRHEGLSDAAHHYGQDVRMSLTVLLGCAVVEGVIVEVVLAALLPHTPWPWILLALHGYGLIWIGGLRASLRTRPHLLTADRLLLRDSVFTEVSIPIGTISGARTARRSGPLRSGFTVDPSGETAVLGYGDTTLVLLLDPGEPVYVDDRTPLTGLHRMHISVDDPRRLRGALAGRSVADGVG